MKKGMKKTVVGLVLAAGVLTVGCGSKGKLDGTYTMKLGKLQCEKFTVENNTVKDYYEGETKKAVKSKYDPKTETITFKAGKEEHELKLEKGKYKFDKVIVNKDKPTQVLDAGKETIKDAVNEGSKEIDKAIGEGSKELNKAIDEGAEDLSKTTEELNKASAELQDALNKLQAE